MRDDIDFRPHHEKHEPDKQNSEPSFEAKGYALHKASSHARSRRGRTRSRRHRALNTKAVRLYRKVAYI
jgi:hypothetical protein